jgi:putative copper resistance protein D
MLENSVVVFRFFQFAGAMILFGAPLFFLLTLPRTAPSEGWMKSLLWLGAGCVLAGTALGLVAQTGVLAGSLAEAIKPDTLTVVVTQMSFGRAALARLAMAAILLGVLAVMRPGAGLWRVSVLAGGAICVSMAWMGHGGATPGPAGFVHLAADIFHLLAAAGWIGALAGFSMLLLKHSGLPVLDAALRKFAGIGATLVGVILASGLVNSYFLVGPERLSGLWTTPYGQLLLLKLALFVTMLGLAARNRLLLSPALEQALNEGEVPSLKSLRWSVFSETATAAAVLAVVAWLGTLAPIAGS